jgi:DnaJ-class molecular chaperone
MNDGAMSVMTCPRCYGEGIVPRYAGMTFTYEECPYCRGSGIIFDPPAQPEPPFARYLREMFGAPDAAAE